MNLTAEDKKRLDMYEILLEHNFSFEEVALTLIAIIDKLGDNAPLDQFSDYCALMKKEFTEINKAAKELH